MPHPLVAKRVARGKAARAEVLRYRHAVFEPSPDRVDPVKLLERRTRRVPEPPATTAIAPNARGGSCSTRLRAIGLR